MAETKAIGKLDEPMVHACGKSFGWIQSYQKHARKCDGKPVETRGRIDRLTKRPVARGSGSPTSTEEPEQEPTRRTPPRGQANAQGEAGRGGEAACEGCEASRAAA